MAKRKRQMMPRMMRAMEGKSVTSSGVGVGPKSFEAAQRPKAVAPATTMMKTTMPRIHLWGESFLGFGSAIMVHCGKWRVWGEKGRLLRVVWGAGCLGGGLD